MINALEKKGKWRSLREMGNAMTGQVTVNKLGGTGLIEVVVGRG